MAKLAKILLILIAGLIGVLVIAAVALKLFFDPNDFRDNISAQAMNATGRELVIEGDLSISIFPWLAVEIGSTTLGNAAGFGDAPFISFENASLSIEIMPLLMRQEISVGIISLDGFVANLSIAGNGTTNWDDLATASDVAPAEPTTSAATQQSLDIANIRLSNASIHYLDAQSDSRYSLTDLTVETGRITLGEPFDVDASFSFAATPGELGGSLSIRGEIKMSETLDHLTVTGLNISGDVIGIVSQPTTFNLDSRSFILDLAAEVVAPGEIDLAILGISMSADVEPFSYAGESDITASLRIADFSLKELMQTLDIEAPVTADPNALTTVSFSGDAKIGSDAMSLSNMTLVLDDTTMTGELTVPLSEKGTLAFNLNADRINLDNYMAPAEEVAVASDTVDLSKIQIPVKLIRSLQAQGSVRLDEAFLGSITFTNLLLGIDSAGGRLRLHPITAEFFEGSYNGDVRIDASGATPTLSVNESISDVSLQSMAQTVFETDNISGTIDGNFALSGRGTTLALIRADLSGTIAINLADGAVEGTDVWHQLRSARAQYKLEDPPEPTLPPRTEFSTIKATGIVTDGVFSNEDLLIELPFLRITGSGTIDLDSTEINYSVQARVLQNPEFLNDVSEDEMADFTQALIPIRIRGTLAAPSFRPDIEAMFRQEVERAIEDKKDELKKVLLNTLLGNKTPTEPNEAVDADPEEEKLEDILKDRLKGLFKN